MLFDVVYIAQEQPNGDILLAKKNLYTDEVIAQRQPNGDILLKRLTTVDPNDISKWDFKGSKIQSAVFNDDPRSEIWPTPSFKKLYTVIHEQIGDGAQIIKHSVLNIKTLEDVEKGFSWYPSLGISVQGVDANKAIFEAITQCQKNDIGLELTIMVKNQTIKINV